MSIDSVSLIDGALSDWESDDSFSRMDQVVHKVQSIWERVFDAASSCAAKVVHIVRSSIGSVFRDLFFFPLRCSLIANRRYVQEQMQIERAYTSNFWDLSKPMDPNFAEQALIRERFLPPQDKTYSIRLSSGKTFEITCRIMETKEARGTDQAYHFVHVPGVIATIDNNIGGTYPFLASYVKAARDGEAPKAARFVIVSENNISEKPSSMEEAGAILLQTLKVLQDEYGEIDQLLAHSLGTVFTSIALRQLDDPKYIPKNLCFDRGPTSVWEVSKKYFWGLGRFFYFLTKIGGWAANIEQDVVSFYQRWKEKCSLVIVGVKQDHILSGGANLCLGEKIRKIKDACVLVFNPPLQIVHECDQHNWRTDYLNPSYLVSSSDFMKAFENLAQALLRHSLDPTGVRQKGDDLFSAAHCALLYR